MKIELEDKDHLRALIIEEAASQILHTSDGDETQFRRKIEEKIDKIVLDTFEVAIRDIAKQELTPRIQKLLDEDSWTVYTGSYGDSARKVTLKDMLRKFLEPRDSYQVRDHFVTKLVDETVKATFAKEFEPVIKAARDELRKRLDTILGEKVSLAVREAVGLR